MEPIVINFKNMDRKLESWLNSRLLSKILKFNGVFIEEAKLIRFNIEEKYKTFGTLDILSDSRAVIAKVDINKYTELAIYYSEESSVIKIYKNNVSNLEHDVIIGTLYRVEGTNKSLRIVDKSNGEFTYEVYLGDLYVGLETMEECNFMYNSSALKKIESNKRAKN